MLDAFYGIKKMLKYASEILFQKRCALCTCETKGDVVCENCDLHLDMALLKESVFSLQNENIKIMCAACFDYNNDRVKRLVFSLKDNGDEETVDYCSVRIMSVLYFLCVDGENTVFTAVPRSNNGMYKFGFDQAELLAKRTAEIFASAKYKRLLARRGFSKEQKNLDEDERWTNISGKFRVKRTCFLNRDYSGNIVIFDDVCTTGASVLECAKEIKRKYSRANVCAVFLAKND